jgi:hypothetical protein
MANLPATPPKGKGKRHWGMPNYLAQARLLAGGDWRAGMLLYRIKQVWDGVKKKLHRCGAEWVAMPGADWARSAGLSESETKNYALPELKANCGEFLRFEAWKVRHDGPKMLWVSINEPAMHESFAYLDDIGLSSGKENYHELLGGVGCESEISEDGKVVKHGKKAVGGDDGTRLWGT